MVHKGTFYQVYNVTDGTIFIRSILNFRLILADVRNNVDLN